MSQEQEQQQLYDLIVTGHSSELKVAELVQKLMAVLGKKSSQLEFKLSEALIFEQNSNSALEGVSLETAEHYQKEFEKLKVKSEVRPTIQLVAIDTSEPVRMFKCPACGHEQPKVKGRLDMCDVCGVIGDRYANSSRLKSMMEDERRRLAQEQAQKVRESLAQADYQERLKLRRIALRRLGFKEGSKWPIWIAAAATLIAIGGGTFWGINYYNKDSEAAQLAADAKNNKSATGGITINPALLQGGNGQPSVTDQAIALMDHGLLPDAPAIKIDNPQDLLNGAQSTNGTTGTVNTPDALHNPMMKNHNGRGYEILMRLEESGLTYPRFKRPIAQHLVDQEYLTQLLKDSQWSMGMVFIDTLTDAYEQGALYVYALLVAPDRTNYAANQSVINEKLQKILQPLGVNDEQRLLLQGVQGILEANATPTPSLVVDSEAFKQVVTQINTINSPEQRITLLVRLANEQYLFNQRSGSQQLLQLAEKDLAAIPAENRQAMAAHLAASYFIIEDDAGMLRMSEQINDATIRNNLFQGLEQVKPLVKSL